jgi:hypothetical protein
MHMGDIMGTFDMHAGIVGTNPQTQDFVHGRDEPAAEKMAQGENLQIEGTAHERNDVPSIHLYGDRVLRSQEAVPRIGK